jgi:hypothetical protein
VRFRSASQSRIECTLERHCRLGVLDRDQIIVLALEAGRGKVRGAGAQQSPVDLIALEAQRRAGFVLGPNLDAYGAACATAFLCVLVHQSA